jgi:glycoprotein 3-alpha-L-fucosyltransferase
VCARSNDVVPIVMGARRADYERAAPPHSFIHVDDFSSASDLATHLLRLNQSDALYNEYFRWKADAGEFVDTKFWCRLCALLHDDDKPSMWYADFHRWWSHPGTCRKRSWNSTLL